MKINIRHIAAVVLAVAMIIPNAVYAEETNPFYICTYYNDEGTLIDVKQITDTPSEKELEILLDLYMPENTATTFWGGLINRISEARIHETNMGDLICDSMIYAVKDMLGMGYADVPVVAVENGGGFRSSFAIGNITAGDIINVLPYANTVMYKEVTPKVIYEMLEQSVSSVHSQNIETGMLTTITAGSYLQIGGMRFEYDPNGEEGSKVKNVYLDGQDKPISRTDETTNIILASNDYVIEGGGYPMLSELELLGEGGGLSQVLTDYVRYLGSGGKALSYPVTDGRITTIGSYAPKDYTANVYIKDESGNAVAETEITYYVDGAASVKVMLWNSLDGMKPLCSSGIKLLQ